MKACLIGASSPVGRVVAGNLSEVPGMEVVGVASTDVPGEVLRQANVIIGCFGGDRRSEESAARGAIKAGVPYLSGAETPEVFQALTELDEEASAAGSLVVAGLSWTPGLTNLMAVLGSRELDEVAQVRVAWTGSSLGPLGPPLLARAIRAFSGDAVVFEDEGWRMEAAGRQHEQVFFPEPAGWRPVAVCAAAEPLSLPASIDGVRKIWVKGGVFEPWAHRMTLRASDPWGSPSDRPAQLSGPSRAAASVISRVVSDSQSWSAARVDVTGMRSGDRETVTFGIVDHLPNLVSAPLVAGAELVASGAVGLTGVVAPEQAFDPNEFFSKIGERGVRLARLHGDRVPARISNTMVSFRGP